MYVDTLQSVAGVTALLYDLTNSSYSGDTIVLTACDSALWNTTTYDSSGVYVDTLQTLAGCDSIVTLDLTINSSYFRRFNRYDKCINSVCRYVTECSWL